MMLCCFTEGEDIALYASTALLSRIVAEWWQDALRHEALTIQARSPFQPSKSGIKSHLKLDS